MSSGTLQAESYEESGGGEGGEGGRWGQLTGLSGACGGSHELEGEVEVGRAAQCGIRLQHCPEVSNRHCRLFLDPQGRPSVQDLNSSNGTFVDGRRLPSGSSLLLPHGAELSLGVSSSASAKKTERHKDSFVAFIFRSSTAPDAHVHPAFREPLGPNVSYDCAKELGSGAFAEVFLCIHRRTGRKYAAKIVDKNKFALNKELRQGSFRDEVEILKDIQHPFIVRVEDIFETDNYLTIILQYVSGGDLFDKIVALKRYQEDDAKIVFKQMAEGVRYLHERGIAHRDLKPENFLVKSNKSDVKILMGDFGLARVFRNNESFMKTLCGTPQVSTSVFCFCFFFFPR